MPRLRIDRTLSTMVHCCGSTDNQRNSCWTWGQYQLHYHSFPGLPNACLIASYPGQSGDNSSFRISILSANGKLNKTKKSFHDCAHTCIILVNYAVVRATVLTWTNHLRSECSEKNFVTLKNTPASHWGEREWHFTIKNNEGMYHICQFNINLSIIYPWSCAVTVLDGCKWYRFQSLWTLFKERLLWEVNSFLLCHWIVRWVLVLFVAEHGRNSAFIFEDMDV